MKADSQNWMYCAYFFSQDNHFAQYHQAANCTLKKILYKTIRYFRKYPLKSIDGSWKAKAAYCPQGKFIPDTMVPLSLGAAQEWWGSSYVNEMNSTYFHIFQEDI